MSNFKGSYLRVLSPITSDGKTLLYDDDREVRMRESHLDIRAKKRMELKNKKLPKHLQHVLEVVGENASGDVKPARIKKIK